MNQTAIAFLTKDRVELSRRSVEPLLQSGKFDLHWFDGSVTDEGRKLNQQCDFSYGNIRGGPDAAVACALTRLLQHPNNYYYIGLCENDVLLHPDWFGPTVALFERGEKEGLHVGAVSPRCYQDRILIQRDGYAVVHNLGWGCQIMTREAAQLALAHMRVTHTIENVLLFSQLADLDIRRWWAFRGAEHFLCADWGNDKILAAHGLASLALTPSPVEMIGQDPPLHEQGLEIADGRFELLRSDTAFRTYVARQQDIREGKWKLAFNAVHRDQQGYLYFPHQLGMLGAGWEGDWRLHWAQGFGPFAWRVGSHFGFQKWFDAKMADVRAMPMPLTEAYFAKNPPVEEQGEAFPLSCDSSQKEAAGAQAEWSIPVLGPCTLIVSGGESGGRVKVIDEQSGYECAPDLAPEARQGALQLTVPGSVVYRHVRLIAESSGVIFYGLRTQVEQPSQVYAFNWNKLPPA